MLRLRTFGGLWVESDDGSRRAGVRPRRLALLALTAAAGTKGRTRDQLLAVLWPDSSPDRARAVLSQTLYNVGSDLGDDVVLASSADLRLDPARLTSDVADFRKAIADQDWSRAASLYVGPFLSGFYLNDATEFERWVEEERTILAREAARAIERVARAATESGRVDDAVEQYERLTRIDPLSSAHTVAYMNALVQRGDRTGAMAHGQAHAALVRRELDMDPEPEIARLLKRLRNGGPKTANDVDDALETVAGPSSSAPDSVEDLAAAAIVSVVPRRRRLLTFPTAVAALALLAFLGWRATLSTAARNEAPVLAVGQVRDLVSPDSEQLGGVLSEMLATSIGRLTQLQVIANSRLLEIIPRGSENLRSARTDAALRAGATQVLEGELIPLPGSMLRFEVRRLDLPSGIVREGYHVDGTDRIALFDSVAVLVASDLGVAAPSRSLAEASTRSPIAYRLYEEGLRALTLYETRAARQLFSAAVKEDSTFAMATYYLLRSEIALDLPEQYTTSDRALALAPRAADRDRLLISAYVLAGRNDPRSKFLADSLVTRYPRDPEALVRATSAIDDLHRAITLLNSAIALDSAAGAEASAYCRLCEAFSALSWRYAWADSVAATQATIRRWMRFRPNDSGPWAFLDDYLMGLGRRAEADAAYRRGIALGGHRSDETERDLVSGLRSDDIAGANAACRRGLIEAESNYGFYRWYCMIGLRMQGRFREAMQIADRSPKDPVNLAVLAMNAGDPLLAAQRFLQLARQAEVMYSQQPGQQARNVTWNLTLAATAFNEGGDTASTRRLIDSVQATGRRSGFTRDPVLHHFLRGLLLAREARHDSAIVEFRASLNAPALGYTRINYEMAKSLIAAGRAADAIPLMRSSLRGGLDGSGLYLTRTEMHELVAKAFDAIGQRDSAAVHYAIVEQAWRHADALLAPRYASASARLDALAAKRLP